MSQDSAHRFKDAGGVWWTVLSMERVELVRGYDMLPRCTWRFSLEKQGDQLPKCRNALVQMWTYPVLEDDIAVFDGIVTEATISPSTDRYVVECTACESMNPDAISDLEPDSEAIQGENNTLRDILQWMHAKYSIPWIEGSFAKDRALLDKPLCFAIRYNQPLFDFLRSLFGKHGLSLLWRSDDQCLVVGEESVRKVPYTPENDPSFHLETIAETPLQTAQDWGLLCDPWKQSGFALPPGADREFRELAPSFECRFTTTEADLHPGDVFESNSMNSAFRVCATRTVFEKQKKPSMDVSCIGAACLEMLPPYIPPYPRTASTVTRCCARVEATDGDPLRMGRIKVRPLLDGKAEKHKAFAWLPVISPYGGRYEGFVFLPEPGDTVLLESLDEHTGLWAVSGTLRQSPLREDIALGEKQKGIIPSRSMGLLFSSATSNVRKQEKLEEKITLMVGGIRMELEQKEDAACLRISMGEEKGATLSLTRKSKGETSIELSSKENGNILLDAGGGDITLKGRKIRLAASRSVYLQTGKLRTLASLYLKSSGKSTLAGKKIYLKT